MKKLLAVLLVGLTPFLVASDFTHKVIIQNGKVIQDMDEFKQIHKNDLYDFYVRNNIQQIGPNRFLVHTMVEYVEEEGFDYPEFNISVKRIYNFGMLDCERAEFNLFTDIFTNTSETVVYIASYQLGEFRSELLTPNTARNAVYNNVCIEYM